jgi:hypothetical protein
VTQFGADGGITLIATVGIVYKAFDSRFLPAAVREPQEE